MKTAPRGMRLHLGIYGRRNVGKSSLLNALTGQTLSIVSDEKGTTTDPVEKAMEIPPLGPVQLIDTAGIDDEGALGALRVEKSLATLNKVDLALLVTDGVWGPYEERLQREFDERKVAYVVVCHQSERINYDKATWLPALEAKKLRTVRTSIHALASIEDLMQAIIALAPAEVLETVPILGDLLPPQGLAILVVPVDAQAPKGRLILPQVQSIRDILDHRAMCMVVKDTELGLALERLAVAPDLVVTDSQIFGSVSALVPESVALTGFSVLFARFKGDLTAYVEGAEAIDRLRPGDRILVAESCTHHPGHDDIGRVKIPAWLTEHVGGPLEVDSAQGATLPSDLSSYQLIVHCGGCMFNRRAMLSRIATARAHGVPITNYGLAIAKLHGIFERALRPFPEAYAQMQRSKREFNVEK